MKNHLVIAILALTILALGCGNSDKSTGDGDEDTMDAPGDTSGDGAVDVPEDTPGSDTGGDTGGDTAGDVPVDAPDTVGDVTTDEGEDGDCTEWYRDSDSDGYGDPADMLCRNAAPEGYVGNDDDCCDLLDDVNPAQTSWFDTSYTCGTVTDSFDYNCDGTEEQRYTTMGSCTTATDGSCVGTEGWSGSSVPACGVNSYWMGVCTRTSTGTTCAAASSMRRQECR